MPERFKKNLFATELSIFRREIMRKYLWAGTILLLVTLVTCYWLFDNGILRLDALLTQGAISLGQVIGWTQSAPPPQPREARPGKRAQSPVPVVLDHNTPQDEDKQPVKLPDDVFLHAPPAQQPLEVIQVEGANPLIARAIFEHLIPSDLCHPPTLATKEEKEAVTKVVFTELRPNGPPRSQNGKVVPGIPFAAWQKEAIPLVGPSPNPGLVMPAADPETSSEVDNSQAQSRNDFVLVSHTTTSNQSADLDLSRTMPFADE
jgi:hypothetical protein